MEKSFAKRAVLNSLFVEMMSLKTFLERHCTVDWSDINGSFAKFLETTLLAATDKVDGPEMTSQSVTLTLSEVIAKAVSRKKERQDVLKFGWKELSERPQPLIAGTSNLEYTENTSTMSVLLDRKWRRLHTMIGDEWMLHLLESYTLLMAAPNNCYMQLTGVPVFATTDTAGAAAKSRKRPPGSDLNETRSKKPKIDPTKAVLGRTNYMYSKNLHESWPQNSALRKNDGAELAVAMLDQVFPVCDESRTQLVHSRLTQLTTQLLNNFKACRMRPLLHCHAPPFSGDVTSTQELLRHHVPHSQVYKFLRSFLLRAIPRELIGSSKNWKVLLSFVKQLVFLGRFDKVSLAPVLQTLERVTWLPKKMTSQDKRAHIGAIWRWIMEQVVFVALKSFFYITENSSHRNRLFYYRKADWSHVHERAMKDHIEEGTLAPIEKDYAERLVQSGQALGVATVRFLPKPRGMRTIVNMRHPITTGPYAHSGPNQSNCNSLLRSALSILQYETKRCPQLLGFSVTGNPEIQTKLREYKIRRIDKNDDRPLYMVKSDIKSCFDSVFPEKLLHILAHILKPNDVTKEYHVRRYVTVDNDKGHVRRKFRHEVNDLAEFRPDPQRFSRGVVKQHGLHDLILIDQNKPRIESSDGVLTMVSNHLQYSLMKVNKQYYIRQAGLSQGSILSTLLCNIYYGDMENRLFANGCSGFSVSEDDLLMRQVDDYLLITPCRAKAIAFMQLMMQGIPEYNLQTKSDKTMASFDSGITSTAEAGRLPWCGSLIHADSLHVTPDHSRYHGLSIQDLMTFDLSASQGQAMRDKVISCLFMSSQLMYLDPDLNDDDVINQALLSIFQMSALRFVAFWKKLPDRSATLNSSQFFINLIHKLPRTLHENTQHMRDTSQRRSNALMLCNFTFTCATMYRAVLRPHAGQFKPVLSALKRDIESSRPHGFLAVGDVNALPQPPLKYILGQFVA